MTKKIYLGDFNKQLYITETGTSFTDQPSFKVVVQNFEGIENILRVQEDILKAADIILQSIGRKTRPFELYLGGNLLNITKEITPTIQAYFPNAEIKKYNKD